MTQTMFVQLQPEPGIQRDGTITDSTQFTDGSWVRFYKGRPKKIGGYKVIANGNGEIIRNLNSFDALNSILLYIGQPSSISMMNVQTDLTTTAPVDRTPAGFVINSDNTWSITSNSYVRADVNTGYVFATACPNNQDISNTIEGIVYYGSLDDTSIPLTPIPYHDGYLMCDGFVMALGSYIVSAGSNGLVQWNDGISPVTWSTDNTVLKGSSKFVTGYPVRNQGTTALLWSLDAVWSMTDSGLSAPGQQFTFAYISTISTILSRGCVVSYEPFFFWPGINTFYMYNGAVQEVPNETNKLWFFENLNTDYKEKVFGYVNKKYNEICWVAPMFGSTECNWEIKYSMTTNQWSQTPWYDTNNMNRSAAVSSTSQMPYPIMASSTPELFSVTPTYPIWAHEFGVDRVDPLRTTAILSYFTTSRSWIVDQNPQAQVVAIDCVIPDVQQTGNMFFTVNTQAYPNSPVQTSDIYTFSPTTEFQTVRIKGSLVSFTFTSNELGGDYLFGKTMIRTIISDDMRPGPSAT